MFLPPVLLFTLVAACDDGVKNAVAALRQSNPTEALRVLEPLSSRCTQSAAFYEAMGLANELSGNKGPAEESLRMAVRLDPRSPRLFTELGATLLKNGKPAEAGGPLNQALALDPSNPVTLEYAIGAAVGSRNWTRSAELFDKLNLQKDSRVLQQEPALILWLAETLVETKQGDRLETLLGPYRRSLPPGLLFSLGTLLAQHAMYRQAVEYFGLIPAETADDALYFNLGLCYSHLRLFDNARRSYFETIDKHPDHVDAYFHVGLDYVASGQTRMGLPWLYKAQGLAPGRPDIAFALAGQLTMLDYFASAQEVLEHASANSPNNPTLLAAEGDLRQAQGDASGASSSYQKALAISPGLPAALVGLARADLMTGKQSEGRSLLNAALARDPEDPIANGELGLLEAAADRWDNALKHLERSWEQNRSNPEIALKLARAYQEKQRPEDALTILQSIAPGMEDSASFHFQLAQVYTLLHRPAEAQSQRNAFSELQANNQNGLHFENPHTYVH
jgi:Flp pilus assembly protein TadD